MHFISWKLVFSCFFAKKISSFSKFQFFKFSINWTWFSTDWKSWIFRPKLTAPFDSCSIPAQSIKICLIVLSIVARFLSTNWNSNFFNFLRVWQISFVLFHLFSLIALDPFYYNFFFFYFLCVKALKVFFLISSKTLLPFLFIQITYIHA